MNAFIAQDKDRLPIEFVVTGITPEPWTIEQLVLRPVSFGDASAELQLARNVARLGAAEANRARNPDPPDELTVPTGLEVSPTTSSPARGAEAVEARHCPRCCRNTVPRPTTRIARSATPRCATSSICSRPAGTSAAQASRRLSGSPSDTTSASAGA